MSEKEVPSYEGYVFVCHHNITHSDSHPCRQELQAENKRLREALENIWQKAGAPTMSYAPLIENRERGTALIAISLMAQAALTEPDAEKQRKGLNNPNRSSGEVEA